VVRSTPTSAPARALARLALLAAGLDDVADAGHDARKSGGLFGGLRRRG
jgi:hypothetical protein